MASFVFLLNLVSLLLSQMGAARVEPSCTKFEYEEKLLEKMVRLEFKVDNIFEEFKRVSEIVKRDLVDMQTLNGRVDKQLSNVDAFLMEAAVNITAVISENTVAKARENVTGEMQARLGDLETKFISVNTTLMNVRCSNGPLSFPFFVIGARGVRGKDWRYGNQDGNPPGPGTVTEASTTYNWVKVNWDAGGSSYTYRMGRGDSYDLKLAEC